MLFCIVHVELLYFQAKETDIFFGNETASGDLQFGLLNPVRNSFDLCHINPFTPKFLKWTVPSLNSDTSIAANRVWVKIINRIAKCVDSDERFHLDLR